MYSALVGALILARAVDDRDFAKEILAEAWKRVAQSQPPEEAALHGCVKPTIYVQ